MKPDPRNFITISLVISAALLFFLYFNYDRAWSSREMEAGPKENDRFTSKTSKQKLSEIETPDEFIRGLTDEERNAKPSDMEMGEWIYFVHYHRENLVKNGIIEFYGLVVDSNGIPLPGVDVEARISQYDPSIAEVVKSDRRIKIEDVVVTTVDSGNFSIKGKTGVQLTFQRIGKGVNYRIKGVDGYGFTFVPKGVNSQFGFSHQPNPANPVIFVVNKERGAPHPNK